MSQYDWLIKAVRVSKPTPADFDTFSLNETNDLLKSGLSFNLTQGDTVEDLERFIKQLLAGNATDNVNTLASFLHSIVRNRADQIMDDQDKLAERLLLAAFARQLGLTGELKDRASELELGNEKQMPSSHLSDVMRSIFRIGEVVISRRRMSAEVGREDDSLWHQCDDRVVDLIGTCVLVLDIEPSLGHQAEFVDGFDHLLQQLEAFVKSEDTAE